MTRSRTVFLFLLAGAGILVALLAALVFLGPRLLNTKAVRDLAMAELERRTGIHLSYARAEVTFFPRPRVVIRGVAIDVPGLAAGTVATLQVDLELIPLLHGNVRNGNILLEDPDFRVRIPPRAKPEKAFSVEEFEGNLSSLLATLRGRAPATVVTVRNGRIELSDGEKPIVVPERTECPGRLSTGADDAPDPLRVPVLGTVFRSSRACTRRGFAGRPAWRRRGSGSAISSTGWPRAPSPGSAKRSLPFAARSKRKGSGRFRPGRR